MPHEHIDPIQYDEPLWRPPSEGNNLIIQATLGCSFNGCTFCSMYKMKKYTARPLEEVGGEIDRAGRMFPWTHRVFLADGDAYGLPTAHLLSLCERLAQAFPRLERVSAYATPFNLLKKSGEEIRELQAAKLNLVYLGIESGSEKVLQKIGKGSPATMEKAIAHANEAGLDISATVILGLGGKRYSQEHIDATAELINRQPVKYLSTLQLYLEEEVEERFLDRFGGDYEPQDDLGALDELERLVNRLAPPRPVIFRSNHATNALPLAGNLPADREQLLSQLRQAKEGARALRPGWTRGL